MIGKEYRSLVSQAKEILRTDDGARYIDFGVEIMVVRKDAEFGGVPGGTNLPSVVEVREPTFIGGQYDTLTRTFTGRPCKQYQLWMVGEKQYEILFNPTTQHNLLYSAEGAGKTVLMAMWVWLQILAAATAGLSGCVGATAPTSARLGTLIREVRNLGPVGNSRAPVDGAWATEYIDAGEMQCASGHTIQFRSTKKQSGATGSPVQGYTWGLGAAMDEGQDSVEQGAYPDVVARLRGGQNAPIMMTATAKQSTGWKSFRDGLSANWTIHRLQYTDTPFVHDSHWVMMQEELSEREWKRRGLALDVGPESQLYHAFDRAHNMVEFPRFGATDVTASVLAKHGPNLHALLGHDPGAIQDYTVVLKAFKFRGEDKHRWYAVGEFRTKRTTSEEHAVQLLEWLQQEHGLQWPISDGDEPQVLLRMDPYGTTDAKTDRSVYLTFRQAGFSPRSAAYSKGKGNGRIPKEARIEMVNSLCCNAKQVRRFYLLVDERGKPVTPLLLESLESSERNEMGQAEMVKKVSKGAGGDLSDPTAALGYAIWQLERRRSGQSLQGAQAN